MSTTGREPYPDSGTDVTDDQSVVIGSRTVGQVVPASRIEALRVERSEAPGTTPAIKSTGGSTGRGGHSPYLGVIVKSSTRRVPLTGNAASDRGVLTHTLIATHAPRIALGESVDDLVPSMVQFAFGMVQTHPNGSRVIAAETVGMARRYLTDLTPGAPWRLLGVEYETGEGPVDLAWTHDVDGRVFFDEIKTSRVAAGRVSASWLQQCGRYSEAGVERFGDGFAGTRLLTLAQTDFARHMSGGLQIRPIKPTRDNPFAAASIGGSR